MLIDFHTHAFPDKLAERALGVLSAKARMVPEINGKINSLLTFMDGCGVDRSVVCNIATNPKQMVNVNNFAIETMHSHGDRLTPLGSIHPQAEGQAEEMERLHKAGIVGLKIHPDYMGYTIDDNIYNEIFDTAAELGMFVITHAGFDVSSTAKVWATPDGILKRLARNPKTIFICAHFGSNMMWTEVEEKLLGKNLYIDTSMGAVEDLGREQTSRMLNKHDSDRILFGSDCPWSSPRETFEYIDSLRLSEDRKDKIYSQNARTLLGI